MKRIVLIALLVAAATLMAPLTAHARPATDQSLRVRLQLPLTFDGCGAHFNISALGQVGTGINCVTDVIPAECPRGVVALFCERVPGHMTLRLFDARIEADTTIFEIWRCGEPDCSKFAVEQRWSGEITDATGRFTRFRGASVSGGGRAIIDAATFEVLVLDEVLVIA